MVIRNDPASVPEQPSRYCIPTNRVGCIRVDARVTIFQKQLQNSSCHHGEASPQNHTIQPSTSELAGVRNRKEIPFHDL